MNLYKDLAIYLNNNDIENYAIGQHEGKCKKPFTVIEEAGEQKETNYTLKIKNVELVVVFPKGIYSALEDYVNKVITVMEGYTRATFTGNISDVMIDTEKEAYIVSLPYKIYKGI